MPVQPPRRLPCCQLSPPSAAKAEKRPERGHRARQLDRKRKPHGAKAKAKLGSISSSPPFKMGPTVPALGPAMANDLGIPLRGDFILFARWLRLWAMNRIGGNHLPGHHISRCPIAVGDLLPQPDAADCGASYHAAE